MKMVRCIVKVACTLGYQKGKVFERHEKEIGEEIDLPVEYARQIAEQGLVHALGEDVPEPAVTDQRRPLVQQGGIFAALPVADGIQPWPEATTAPEGLAQKVS